MTNLNLCKSSQKLVKGVTSSRFLKSSARFALARVSPVLEKHHLLWSVTHHKLEEKPQDYGKQQKKALTVIKFLGVPPFTFNYWECEQLLQSL